VGVASGRGTGKLRAGNWLLMLLLLVEDPESESVEEYEDALESLVELLLQRLLRLLLLVGTSVSFASSLVSFPDPMLFCRTS